MIYKQNSDTTNNHSKTKKILIVTSVQAEKNALVEGLSYSPHIDVEVVGVGPISSSVETTKIITKHHYDLIICAGIAGGFVKHTSIGTVVLSDQVIAADLGAESPEGFLSLEKLELGTTVFSTTSKEAQLIKSSLQTKMINTVTGTILTLATVTGTENTTKQLSERYPYALAEAMEGFGVASAAAAFSIPFVEIRAISNHIGPRDKSKWRFAEAFTQLKQIGAILQQICFDEVQ